MEGILKSKAAAARALALDPDLAEAHSAVGTLAFMFEWDWEHAEASLKRAIALDPAFTWAYHMYANLLTQEGRFDEAIEQMRRAQRLDPASTSPTIIDLGFVHALKGELEQAAEAWQEALELAPDDYRIHRNLGIYACRTGDFAKGLEWLERATTVAHDEELLLADIGHCQALAGQRELAEAALAKLEQAAERMYVDPVHFALVYVGLGDTEHALELLERAYENQAAHLTDVPVDPRYESLGSNPRYEAIVNGIGLGHLLPPPRG